MRNFFSFLKLEYKRILSLKYLAVFSLVFITLLYFTFNSIREYKSLQEKEKNFKLNSEKVFNRVNNYDSYSYLGIKILFIPSQNGILFSMGILSNNSIASINSIYLMDLSNYLEGKSINSGTAMDYTNYATLMMAILSLISIFYGYYGVKKKDFFRMIFSFTRYKILYLQFLFARFLSLIGYVILLNILFLGVLSIIGFNFSMIDLKAFIGFILSLIVVLLIFFLIGNILANCRIKKNIGIIASLIWFVLVFMIPPLFNSIISDNLSGISNSVETDSAKIGIINKFENEAAKRFGKADKNNRKKGQKVIEGYWNNEFLDVEQIDIKSRMEKESAIRKYQFVSIFTPVSFYNMTALEAGSNGYENYLKFTDYAIKKRREFVRFWIDRVYYNDQRVMVNFVKNSENIFHGHGALPATFAAGAGVNLLYIIVLFFISHSLFHRSLFLIQKKDLKFKEPVNTLIHQEKVQDIYVCSDGRFKNIIFSMFSGYGDYLFKNGFEGKFTDQQGKIDFSLKTQDFLYICEPEALPQDINVSNLIRFFASLGRVKKEKITAILEKHEMKEISKRTIESLSNDEKCEMMLAVTELIDKKIYLIYNIGNNTTRSYVVKMVKRLETLSETATRVLYLTNMPDVEEEKPRQDFPQSELARWLVGVQIIKHKDESKKNKVV